MEGKRPTAAMIRLVLVGHTLAEIGAKFGVTKQAVQQRLKCAGFEYRYGRSIQKRRRHWNAIGRPWIAPVVGEFERRGFIVSPAFTSPRCRVRLTHQFFAGSLRVVVRRSNRKGGEFRFGARGLGDLFVYVTPRGRWVIPRKVMVAGPKEICAAQNGTGRWGRYVEAWPVFDREGAAGV